MLNLVKVLLNCSFISAQNSDSKANIKNTILREAHCFLFVMAKTPFQRLEYTFNNVGIKSTIDQF